MCDTSDIVLRHGAAFELEEDQLLTLSHWLRRLVAAAARPNAKAAAQSGGADHLGECPVYSGTQVILLCYVKTRAISGIGAASRGVDRQSAFAVPTLKVAQDRRFGGIGPRQIVIE